MRNFTLFVLITLAPGSSCLLLAQDSVDVTFRYKPPAGQTAIYVTGEFNGWQPSSLSMSPAGDGFYERTVRLRVGGHTGGVVSGAYQYKFYYPEASPWPGDPLNPHTNPSDNDNSVLYITNPTIYHILADGKTGIIDVNQPIISAHIFPATNSAVDTSAISLRINGTLFTGIGSSYDSGSALFTFLPSETLLNGSYSIGLSIGDASDSVSIIIQAGFVQIRNVGGFQTINPQRIIRGVVEDPNVDSVRIVRNASDTATVAVVDGVFTFGATLVEGVNSFTAIAVDSTQATQVSDPVEWTHIVPHAPTARISFYINGNDLTISAATSSDPDSGQSSTLTFSWDADSSNPEPTSVSGNLGSLVISKPSTPGEYYYRLIAEDSDNHRDTTRNFFIIHPNGSFETAGLATIPGWAKRGRMYELFFKSLTPEGTINAGTGYLPYLKSLGVNILWVMPVMHNAHPINNGPGPGYNIKDFYRVAPEYGTNQDFKDFVAAAHALEMKVILDVTPNHTSSSHPFVQEARLFRENARHWDFYEHEIIPHNDNNLGQSLTPDGFNYYSGFSDQLLNYDWSDPDARHYMTEVYRHWIKEYGLDGYRYDVYWGPRRRYGEQTVGRFLREAIRHDKPDVLLLAEDDGVGSGSEVIYADENGGVDSGYDWLLYHQSFKTFNFSSPAIDGLHERSSNNGYYPGPNALYLRFLENHDEDRISYLYNGWEKTAPMATILFTIPGLPMIYSGQEVGYGPGIASFDERRRGVINWNSPGGSVLRPHYQKLAHLRGQFPAFSNQTITRISSGKSLVYAFSRPAVSGAGLVVANFGAQSESMSVSFSAAELGTVVPPDQELIASELLTDSAYTVTFVGGSGSLEFPIEAYGSRVFVFSDTAQTLDLPVLVSVEEKEDGTIVPSETRLLPNYPNPFNPRTTILFEMSENADVVVSVYNLLGQEVQRLVDGRLNRGRHTAIWNGETVTGSAVSSGVYIIRLTATGHTLTRKILLIR